MLKNRTILVAVVVITTLIIFISYGQSIVPAEKLEILSGIGADVVQNKSGEKEYQISLSVYTFKEKDIIGSMVKTGTSMNIPRTRGARQLQSDRRFISALQKVVIFSEDSVGDGGLESYLDILFTNPLGNDMSWAVVCKGTAIDLLKHKVENYPSSSDYINELIDNSKNFNFFSGNYKIMDMYVRVDSEGRNLILPYIETIENMVEITGMALFKKDKMVKKIDIPETRIMNLLREDNVNGILSLQKNFEQYASSYCQSKRKVTCQKEDDRYKFTIDLNISGDVVNNTMLKGMESQTKIIKQYEKALESQTKKQCMDFIDKMQNDFKIDCLELGRVACAKYGRKTGVDWNDVVSNSDIEVNVKVNITRLGRGRYLVD